MLKKIDAELEIRATARRIYFLPEEYEDYERKEFRRLTKRYPFFLEKQVKEIWQEAQEEVEKDFRNIK